MKYHIKTFGCQMNENDSEKMAAFLEQSGYQAGETPEDADVLVLNTCSVREKSYHKAVSQIGLWTKQGSVSGRKRTVVVTGCVASHEGKKLLKRFPEVDVVLGPDHLASLPKLVEKATQGARISQTDFSDLSDYEFPAPLSEVSRGKQVKAFVTIMKGCDNACSFCIVPFVRGPEVSRSSDDILREIKNLEMRGVREVMLLGQNVNSYGKGLKSKLKFAELLRLIDEQTSISRVRFTSPHPKDLSFALMEEYVRNEKLCRHLHLPVQSGSNSVLKKMRRSYTRETYLRKIARLREVAPDLALTTDLIVGFPGETEEDFQKTLSLVQEVGFDASYCFAYSPRPNTEAAALFPDDVPISVKKERLKELQDVQEKISLERNQSRVGRKEAVLVEGASGEKPGQLMGRTSQGRIVNFDGGSEIIGDILDCEITAASAYSLKGQICSSK